MPCLITYTYREQKYTVPSIGIWEYIRRALAVDPNRSNGVPMNLYYRNPPPGATIQEAYEDPVTAPAGAIADNAYFKRDTRRNYPRLSVINQGDVVGLLSFSSRASPSLRIGDASTKQLEQVQQGGKAAGISAFLKRNRKSSASILGPDGLPPFPSRQGTLAPGGGNIYRMNTGRTEGYPGEYVLKSAALGGSLINSCQLSLPHIHLGTTPDYLISLIHMYIFCKACTKWR